MDTDKITTQQLQEIETLRTICVGPDEFEELIPGKAFIIQRTSPSKRALVSLRVTYTENYPLEMPDIQVKSVRGLTPTNCVMLQSLLESTAQENVGTPMALALITATDDWLRKNTTTVVTDIKKTMPSTSTTTTTTSTTTDPFLIPSTSSSYEDYKDYDCLNPQKIINLVEDELSYVSELLKIPQTTARILLTHYAWNKENLIMDFLDSPSRVLLSVQDKVGSAVVVEEGRGNEEGSEKGENGEKSEKGKEKVSSSTEEESSGQPKSCPGCFDEDVPFTTLTCGHFFCNDCWKEYLSLKIKEGKSSSITCPAYKCGLAVDEDTVKTLVDQDTYQRYNSFLVRSFVDNNPYVKWCPAPGCENAIKATVKLDCTVVCNCGNSFCFNCSKEGHFPCTCPMIEKWAKNIKDEKNSFDYISKFTKDCPNCNTAIEKNGGCNKMTCGHCHFEFCWICLANWKTHNFFFTCNKFAENADGKKSKGKPMTGGGASKQRGSLEKYLHYFTRYANHDRSRQFEAQIRKGAEKKLEMLEKRATSRVVLSPFEKDFRKAVDVLLQCRRVLKYTYVFGYYFPKDVNKNIFEFLQEDLETATEKLSEVLENSVEDDDLNELVDIDAFIMSTRDAIASATQMSLQRLKNITDQIEKEFTPEPEEEEETKKKKGKNQPKRKGIIGGAHPTSQTQIVCVGEWAYPVELSTTGPVKEEKVDRKASAAELERYKQLGFEVAGDEEDDYHDEEDDEEDYDDRVAEKILKKRSKKGQGVEYLVKWKGLPESKATWEPANRLDAWNLVQRFESNWKIKHMGGKQVVVAAAPKKKKVKKQKEDLTSKQKKEKENEVQRLLEEQIKYLSKQDMTRYHALPQSTIEQKALEFVREYFKNQKNQAGALFAWGSNSDGMLGHLGTIEQLWPLVVDAVAGVHFKKVAAGQFHSLALTDNNEVYAFGLNEDGQCGLDTEETAQIKRKDNSSTRPTRLPAFKDKDIIDISAGSFHSLFLAEDGVLYCCGRGDEFQLGLSDAPLAMETRDLTLEYLMESASKFIVRVPTRVSNLDGIKIVNISCGRFHSACVDANGTLYTWGRGANGQLGHGDNQDQAIPKKVEGALKGVKVKQVACGENHTALITEDGTLFTAGGDEHGQLGIGITWICMTHGGTCEGLSWNCQERIPMPKSQQEMFLSVIPAKRMNLKLVQVSCGWGFCAGLSDMGNLWTWGKGTALGLGPTGDEAEPKKIELQEIFVDVSCGATHVAAIAEGGKLYTWGSGENGRLGDGKSHEEVCRAPRLVTQFQDPQKARCLGISCGPNFTLAISSASQNLARDIGSALCNEEESDVTFILEGKYSLKAHKSILCIRSAYFKNLFRVRKQKREAEGKPDPVVEEIPVDKVNSRIFRALLEYIYTDQVQDLSTDMANQVLLVAKRFKLERLQNICECFLRKGSEVKQSHFMEDFRNAINDKETSDVAFRIAAPFDPSAPPPPPPSSREKESEEEGKGKGKEKEKEKEEELVYAHKAVLTYRCEYFRNMFRSGMMESSADVLTVTYADRDTFLAILEFIYTDDVVGAAKRKALMPSEKSSSSASEDPKDPQPERIITKTKKDRIAEEEEAQRLKAEEMDLTIEMGVALIELADLFELPLLKETCEKRMLSKVRVDNVAIVYYIALLHRAELLKRYCVEIIFQQYGMVKATHSWMELPLDVQDNIAEMRNTWWKEAQRRGGRRV